MKKTLVVALALSVFAAGCAKALPGGPPRTAAERPAAKYYCPMHPTYTSDKPGNCPICGMKLVPLTAHEDPSDHEMKPTPAQTVCLRHTCPMIQAGKECPMLIVSEPGEVPECPYCKKQIAAEERQPVSSDHPEGYAVVALTPAKQKAIGLTTAPIQKRPLEVSIRTAGLTLAGAEMDLFVYESDLPRIRPESVVKAVFPALGAELRGQVSRIPLSTDRGLPPSSYGPSAILSAASNQVTVRARMEDPDRLLRRGMTADAEIRTDLGTVTALPEEAVFFTGKQNIVFVEKSPGVYEPRSVRLGAKADGYYEVLSGAEPGETVVTSGNFLIDSESRLRSTLAAAVADGETPAHAH